MSVIAGCGGSPRLDTTSKESLEASMKTMEAGMTDAQKREFAGDRTTAVGPSAMQAAMKNNFNKDNDKSASSPTDIYKSLNGMTVEEIHAKAEENRKKARGG